MLTILIPFFNGHHHLERLLDTLPANLPVLIVDDKSDIPLTEAGRARVIRMETKGYFTGAVNRGLSEISEGDVLILNQDTYFTNRHWLKMIEQYQKEYGLIGEGVTQHRAWPDGYIHGTFMFIRRDVLDALGPMAAEWYPLWGSTCEYQLRAARKDFKAFSFSPGQISGFVHKRQRETGDSITHLLKTEGKRGLFIRTPPMISVIINCYNHGQFLSDAINSLIGGPTCLGNHSGQTFQAFEVIIVDDGSTDDTPEVCQKLVDSAKGVHYIRQNNYGSAAAMNTGIQRAYGKYIAVLDADDMMEPNRLELMLRMQENNPHSVVYDDAAYFSQNGQGWVRGFTTKKGWALTKELPRVYDFEKIVHKNMMHKGLMFPKKAWEEVGGYPPLMNRGREDWAFNVALGAKGWCGIHTGQAGYLYRRNWTSRTFTNTNPAWRKIFLAQMQELFPEIYEGIRPMGCCGGGRGRATVKTNQIAIAGLPGKTGMVVLEYNGLNAGDETWFGPVTGQVYVFGGGRKRGYVDKRDAGERPGPQSDGKGLLAMRENGRWIFNVWQTPPVEMIEIQPEEPELELMSIEAAAPEDIQKLPALDPNEMTVTELRNVLVKYSYPAEYLQTAIEIEMTNKNRSSALQALKNALA